jgi:hypothetical protein
MLKCSPLEGVVLFNQIAIIGRYNR